MNEKQLIEAGRAANKILESSRSLIKEGTSYLEVAERIDKGILDSGCGIAFPVNISVNDIAAHDTAKHNDDRVFRKEDVVKIDLGVHVDGFIADTAYTKEITTSKHGKLIECTNKCVEAGLKLVRPGVKICEIGEAVQAVMESYGFSVVRNLVGHGLGRYTIHSGVNIPNYKTKSGKVLEEGMQIAIEPYATYGKGHAINSKNSEIFSLIRSKPVRMFKARKIIEWAVKERKTLPFCKRWVYKEFGGQTDFLLNLLVRAGVIKNYPTLKEISGKKVSQREHTVIVKETPIITTKKI